jgi:hypothetical protein
VIFSHGLLSSLQRNTAQKEHLANHVYLVLSTSHPPPGTEIPRLIDFRRELTFQCTHQRFLASIFDIIRVRNEPVPETPRIIEAALLPFSKRTLLTPLETGLHFQAFGELHEFALQQIQPVRWQVRKLQLEVNGVVIAELCAAGQGYQFEQAEQCKHACQSAWKTFQQYH